jgi:hypothetical protein
VTAYQISKHDFIVRGDLRQEKLHLNVPGFERYKFSMELKSSNKTGEKLGALEFQASENGRSRDQAYAQALAALREYIENNVDELNID